MNTPALLRGVDLAALAAAMVARLRTAGILVSASGQANFVQAFGLLRPQTTSTMYWAARLTLINRMEDLPTLDAVMREIFGSIQPGDTRSAESVLPLPGPKTPAAGVVNPAVSAPDYGARKLPWATRNATAARGGTASADVLLPDLLPSRIAALADESFDRFEPDELRLLGDWLKDSLSHWPRRRSLRSELNPHGRRVDLRATISASRSTGWETVTLARTRPRHRPRRVVLVCDVSRSMRPFATIYLHLMRAAMVYQAGIRPEVFAFSTRLTRLTAVLSHRSPERALEHANAKVTDRYGGTFIGRSINALLTNSGHGNALRGAVVIIASDGWDSDPPEVLERALVRLRRRAHTLVWLNPRAAQPDFEPLAGSMAAALPFCNLFLPANSLAGLQQLFIRLRQPVTSNPALR